MEKRLENLKNALGLNWGELADFIGISRSMLDFLRTGVRTPGAKVLRKIEQAERQLVGKTGQEVPTKMGRNSAHEDPMTFSAMPELEGKPIAKMIPVVGMAAAAGYDPTLAPLCELWEGSDDQIPCVLPDIEGLFALRIMGDSMAPKLLEGDVIAVRNITPKTGDICVTLHRQDGVLCKKWYWRNGIIRLEAINESGKTYSWTKDEFMAQQPLIWRWRVEALVFRKLTI